jgi:hypothetical protein
MLSEVTVMVSEVTVMVSEVTGRHPIVEGGPFQRRVRELALNSVRIALE